MVSVDGLGGVVVLGVGAGVGVGVTGFKSCPVDSILSCIQSTVHSSSTSTKFMLFLCLVFLY